MNRKSPFFKTKLHEPSGLAKKAGELLKTRVTDAANAQRRRTCVHEAAHCVVCLESGIELKDVQIRTAGSVYPDKYIGWRGWINFVYESTTPTDALYTTALVGGLAEIVICGGKEQGISGDLEFIDRIRADRNLPADTHATLLKDALAAAEKIINRNLAAVEAIAEALMVSGSLNKAEVLTIFSDQRAKNETKAAAEARARAIEVIRTALASAKRIPTSS